MDTESAFISAYQGRFSNLLRWPDFQQLIQTLLAHNDGNWYLYALGEPPPAECSTQAESKKFLLEIQRLIEKDHDEDYCGIVYVDDRQKPGFVKFYDPNNLGASCGSSGKHVFPGWIMSRLAPDDLKIAFPLPANRRRWWRNLFG